MMNSPAAIKEIMMNSNSKDSKLPEVNFYSNRTNRSNVIEFPTLLNTLDRDTFGIIDADGKRYKDIKRAYLHARIVTLEEVLSSSITKSPSAKDQIEYKIQLDSKCYREIKSNGLAKCLISFQQRTTGNFALIRLFKD
jgi:hypothetical protein